MSLCLFVFASQKQCLMSFLQEHFITLQAHVRCQFKHTLHIHVHHNMLSCNVVLVENKQRTNGREMSPRHFLNAIKVECDMAKAKNLITFCVFLHKMLVNKKP